MMLRNLSSLIFALIFVVGFTSCSTNPATGGSGLLLVSSKKEKRVGDKLYTEIMQDETLYGNEEWHVYVNLLGQQIAENSDWPDQEFKFFVLDSEDVNAFALPNAHIFITTGMLMHLNKESHLAAVLAHEIAHVTARHTARKLTRNTLLSTVAEPLGIAAWSIPGFGIVAGKALDAKLAKTQTVLVKGYGRELELQADTLGARYLAASGYHPEDMIEVLQILKNHEEYRRDQVEAEASSEFDLGVSYHASDSDTHPTADRRLQEIITAAQDYLGSDGVREDRENYLLMIDGLPLINRQKYMMDPDWSELFSLGGEIKGYIPYTFESLADVALASDHIVKLPSDVAQNADFIALDTSHKVYLDEQKVWASRYSNNILIFHVRPKPQDRDPKEFLLEFINERSYELDYYNHHKVVSRFGEGYFIKANALREFEDFRRQSSENDKRQVEHLYGSMFIGNRAVVVETYGGAFDFDTIMHSPLFISVLQNLRPSQMDDKIDQQIGQQEYEVTLKQVEPGDTFAALASGLLIDHAEEKLRLINGMYPSGEPEVGQRVKIFNSGK